MEKLETKDKDAALGNFNIVTDKLDLPEEPKVDAKSEKPAKKPETSAKPNQQAASKANIPKNETSDTKAKTKDAGFVIETSSLEPIEVESTPPPA